MPKIMKATDYGYRKVIVVCENPDDPEWVHAHGPAPIEHTGDTLQAQARGVEPCPECRYSWRMHEFLWTGDELYYTAADGSRRKKADSRILHELTDRIAALQPGQAADISALTGVALSA